MTDELLGAEDDNVDVDNMGFLAKKEYKLKQAQREQLKAKRD